MPPSTRPPAGAALDQRTGRRTRSRACVLASSSEASSGPSPTTTSSRGATEWAEAIRTASRRSGSPLTSTRFPTKRTRRRPGSTPSSRQALSRDRGRNTVSVYAVVHHEPRAPDPLRPARASRREPRSCRRRRRPFWNVASIARRRHRIRNETFTSEPCTETTSGSPRRRATQSRPTASGNAKLTQRRSGGRLARRRDRRRSTLQP